MINNKIKHKDKTNEINSLISKIPFETCYSTRVVVGSGIFSPYDPKLPIIDNYLFKKEQEVKDMYKDIITPALSYTISRIKSSKWIDENGCEIIDKYHYFQKSLNRNIDRVTKNIVNTNWVGSDVDLDSSYIENEDDLGSNYTSSETNEDDIASSDTILINNYEADDELPF